MRTGDTGWNSAPLAERLRWAAAFRRLLAARADRLAEMIVQETGKSLDKALMADIGVLLTHCAWNERHARKLLGPRRPGWGSWMQLGTSLTETRAPLGRVAIIATWNYPVQLLGIQLVQALLAGNEVIVKPSEHAPRTQAALLEFAVEAGLPPGALQWTEASRSAGARLIAENELDHVVFTGSTAVGRDIARALAERLIPSTLELSGRDSALVLADADPAHAATRLWRSLTANAGQTCMAPRRILAEPPVYAPLVREFERLAHATKPARLISAEAAAHVRALVDDAVRAGARALSAPAPEPADPRIAPVVAVVDCSEHAPLVDGDHFGPATALVPVRDLEHALAIHDRIGQHLATSIFTRDHRRAAALAPRLRSSHVTINDVVTPTAHPAATLGGHRASGWGVSRGRAGLLAMTRSVTISRPAGPVRLPSDVPDDRTLTRLRAFLGLRYGGPRWNRLADPASIAPAPANPRALQGDPARSAGAPPATTAP